MKSRSLKEEGNMEFSLPPRRGGGGRVSNFLVVASPKKMLISFYLI